VNRVNPSAGDKTKKKKNSVEESVSIAKSLCCMAAFASRRLRAGLPPALLSTQQDESVSIKEVEQYGLKIVLARVTILPQVDG